MRTVSAVCNCIVLLALACGDSGDDGRDTQVTAGSVTASSISVGTTPPATVGGESTGGGMTAADVTGGEQDGTAAATGDPPDDTGGVKFDTAKETTTIDPATGEPMGGCNKIDFLFVVDNSGSMADEQQALANSFDGFITSIQNTVMAKDYHIMVIDTDAGGDLEECFVLCGFLPDCNGIPCDMLPMAEGCDDTLGAGLINDPNGQACGYAGPDRFMVDGQPDLAGTFECVAKVGTDGDGSERPMEAMVAATGTLNTAGMCNEGFIRKDALLVVTFITDEEDDEESNGNPVGWNAALVAAKQGKETSIVVLGLIGDGDTPNPVCTEGLAEPSPRLREFSESFTYGSWGSICSLDYAPFFDSAVSVIDTACEQFEPPG
jgi:hypothetical protein